MCVGEENLLIDSLVYDIFFVEMYQYCPYLISKNTLSKMLLTFLFS